MDIRIKSVDELLKGANLQALMKYLLGVFAFVFISLFFLTITLVVSEKNAFATREELHLIYEANMNPCMNYWTTDPSYKDTVSMHMQAMRLYDKHEYNLALEAFQRFEPNETEEGYYNLYSGICLLVSNLDNLAINKFKEAIYFSKKYDQIQLSRWYLAMALLKTGNKPEAILTLKKIIEVNAPMRYQAQLIVDRIDTDTNPIKQMFAMVSPKAK